MNRSRNKRVQVPTQAKKVNNASPVVEYVFEEAAISSVTRVVGGEGVPLRRSKLRDFTVDSGKVLSMHQPWASLLIRGIKRAEGRSWDINVKGWLWIHAASAATSADLTEQVCAPYRNCFPTHAFPVTYPKSCILGRVFVESSVTRDEYASLDRDEENDSNFVLLCTQFEELDEKPACSGEHKIWDMERAMFTRCSAALEKQRKERLETVGGE